MKKRGFQVVSKYKDQNINLPKRQTKLAAGYDLEAATDFVVPSIWKLKLINFFKKLVNKSGSDVKAAQEVLKPVLVPTGLKVYLQPNEALLLVSRSSGPLKRGLVMPNSVGVIDADYYNNPKNEGEIFVQMSNFFPIDRKIKKGERICQGIFINYLTTDDDIADGKNRTGGFGSSGK